jgi:hypothetical protein
MTWKNSTTHASILLVRFVRSDVAGDCDILTLVLQLPWPLPKL